MLVAVTVPTVSRLGPASHDRWPESRSSRNGMLPLHPGLAAAGLTECQPACSPGPSPVTVVPPVEIADPPPAVTVMPPSTTSATTVPPIEDRDLPSGYSASIVLTVDPRDCVMSVAWHAAGRLGAQQARADVDLLSGPAPDDTFAETMDVDEWFLFLPLSSEVSATVVDRPSHRYATPRLRLAFVVPGPDESGAVFGEPIDVSGQCDPQ